MREHNDIAGLLFGDHASLPITKLFVDLRLSPDYASVGFFVAGLAGSALQAASGGWALAGALLLVLYYVLDCVDGEVARFQGVVDVSWGYYDYIFHMVVKPLAFFGVGLGVVLEGGNPWLLCAAFAASVATLWRKIFIEIPRILFVKLLDRAQGTGHPPLPLPAAAGGQPEPGRPRARGPFSLSTVREFLTNFDIGLLFLVAACAADLLLSTRPLGLSFRALWLCYYGVVLPLDFLDFVATMAPRRRFRQEWNRLLGMAEKETE